MKLETKMLEGMTDEEREDWLEEIRDAWTDLQERLTEATSPALTEPQWAEYERRDLYISAVMGSLSPGEVQSIEESLDPDDEDLTEGFYKCCTAASQCGRTPTECAYEWRQGGGR